MPPSAGSPLASSTWWIRAASHLAFIACTAKPVIGAGMALSLGAGLSLENAFGVPAWQPAGTSALLGLLGASTMSLQSNAVTRSFAWLLMLASSGFANRAFHECGHEPPPIHLLIFPVLAYHSVCLWRARKEGPRPKVFAAALAVGFGIPFLALMPYPLMPQEQWHTYPVWISGPLVYGGMISAGFYAVLRLRRGRTLSVYALAAALAAALFLDITGDSYARPEADPRVAVHCNRPSICRGRRSPLRRRSHGRADQDHRQPRSQEVRQQPPRLG